MIFSNSISTFVIVFNAVFIDWINIAALGLKDPVVYFEHHGVGLSDGRHFGATPGTYLRFNFGCPRATLAEALVRMKRAAAAVGPRRD